MIKIYAKLCIPIIFEGELPDTFVIQNERIHFVRPIQYLYKNGKISISDVSCKRRLDIVLTLVLQYHCQPLQYILIYSAFAYLTNMFCERKGQYN